jgi:hypothetical protein
MAVDTTFQGRRFYKGGLPNGNEEEGSQEKEALTVPRRGISLAKFLQ